MFKGNLTFHTKLFNCFTPIIFYHVPPIFLDKEGICFGAPSSHIPPFVEDGEDVFCNYLHVMGGIRKGVWLGDFCMKFSSQQIKKLTLGTFVWMLEHISHRAVIVADDKINECA